jgi:hypothetical protein
VQQHASYLRIIRRRLHLRREQLQLLRLTLLVEDLDRLRRTRHFHLSRRLQRLEIENRHGAGLSSFDKAAP